jgi:hypothetical protein
VTVESLLAEINKASWLVTEIYQRHEAAWFAVLRRSGDFSAAHGEGKTIGEALTMAWAAAQKHKRMTNADWQKLKNPTQPKGSIPRIKP